MTGLEHLIGDWYLAGGYLGVVLAMALESCCIPLPSEVVMPLAGVYVLQYPDRFTLLGVAAAGALGCVVGSAIAYAIGRSGGRSLLLRYGRYVLISQADAERADRLFGHYGSPVVLFARLLPIVRTYISLPAGMARMPFLRFCLYSLVGSLLWCLALAWVGMKVGEHSSQLATLFHGLDGVVGAGLVVAVVWYIWRHMQHDRLARAQPGQTTSTASHMAHSDVAALDTAEWPHVLAASNRSRPLQPLATQAERAQPLVGLLSVQDGPAPVARREFVLEQPRVTIGRSRECTIVVQDTAVSRLHATIWASANPVSLFGATTTISQRYMLRDEQSANHTLVNGEPVNERLLQAGDLIRIGSTVLLFSYQASP
jgi:membrane protein DedA with SNARE-associated domain